jgi:crotonobetainyl-CoA:carnitine CoA-transferase CaiB-like acyl-CoA transferase
MLDGLRVVEIADEQAEYVGMVLAGLGAQVIKIEPPGGSATRAIGPFFEDLPDSERSLFFWQYNRGKDSVVLDLEQEVDRGSLLDVIAGADLVLESTPRGELDRFGIGIDALRERFPWLVVARMSAFGDVGPWSDYKGSDLVHLALGGQAMNCGYDPLPDGRYDLPPIAPQMWHAYHVAGENLLIGILAALYHRGQTGEGQTVSCSVHEAASKNTEVDLMSWVMRRAPVLRQTCRHAAEVVSLVPSIQQTKDGRWQMVHPAGRTGGRQLSAFLDRFGMRGDLPEEEDSGAHRGRAIPGTSAVDETLAHTLEVVQRVVRKFSFADFPWRLAQEDGVMTVPLRRPEENLGDEHWQLRGTYSQIDHHELGRSFTYVTKKWIASETEWRADRPAPQLDEHSQPIGRHSSAAQASPASNAAQLSEQVISALGKPFPLQGVRILDFGWFLASAGGTRFLAALGAQCIKVEWAAHPDTRIGAMAPVGGREARRQADRPLPGVDDPDMGGQFNNKNAGKLGISLNVRHPDGLVIAKQLIARCDIVAEGFSPGVLDRWGLSFETLKSIKPDIIYAQQSGMGAHGTYGRFRAIGPIAASLSGLSEMSGLPEPAMPAGWGYSYLDWIGAYSFAVAMLAALNYRQRTGKGQRIDASQTETGLFIGGTAVLDWSANRRPWRRYGNRSPYKQAAPHGIYPCAGEDRWIAIACFSQEDWSALVEEAQRPEWLADPRFASLADRLEHQDELDTLVAEWTRGRERYELMQQLQARGVPAGVCQTAEDRVDCDPQLEALNWLTELTGTKIGTWPVADVSARLSATPGYIGGPINRGAPIYGEDNDYVYGELLGMSPSEIASLKTEGAI